MRTIVESEVGDGLSGLGVGRPWRSDGYRRPLLRHRLLSGTSILQSIPSFEVNHATWRKPSLVLKTNYRLPRRLVIGVEITSRIAESKLGNSCKPMMHSLDKLPAVASAEHPGRR